MKKLLLFLLSFLLVFTVCKKDSTSEEQREDEVTIKVYVEKAGQPLFNAYVELTCTINMPVSDTYNLGNTRPNPVSDTNTIQTGHDGIATKTYVNRSLVGDDGIKIEAVEVRHQAYGVIYNVDNINILVERNSSYTYEAKVN